MKFEIVETDEIITSNAGLVLVGRMLKNYGKCMDSLNKASTFKYSDIFKSFIGMLTLGKCHYDNIEIFRKDIFFKKALEIKKVPSSSTLRQKIDQLSIGHQLLLQEESLNVLKNYTHLKISPVAENYVAVDVDVTPLDNSNSKKEGVSFTYKKFMGYAPIMAYLGKEGYCINSQLRDGDTHCQKGTTHFLRQTIENARILEKRPLLFRLDSGNDSIENIKLFEDKMVDYIVKRNPRRESLKNWLEIGKSNGVLCKSTDSRDIYQGWSTKEIEESTETVKIAYQVSLVKARGGQLLIEPEIEFESYYTSLAISINEIIALYHDHATSEQFHAEIKSELDIERMPSGKFSSNSIIFTLGCVAYNVLRMIGIEMANYPGTPLRKKAERRRIKTVMQNIMYMACKLIKHARQHKISVPIISPWLACFKNLASQFT
jgi:hypothetical protein